MKFVVSVAVLSLTGTEDKLNILHGIHVERVLSLTMEWLQLFRVASHS